MKILKWEITIVPVALAIVASWFSTTVSGDGMNVVRVEIGLKGKPAQVWINSGARDGVLPGMKLDMQHKGSIRGGLEITEAEAHIAKGTFTAYCRDCLPSIGDTAVFPAGSFAIQPPPILVPGDSAAARGGGDFEELAVAFRVFMQGGDWTGDESRHDQIGPIGKADEYKPPECSSREAAAPAADQDLKADIFLSPGDRVRVDGWPLHSPFCPRIDVNGLVRFPNGLRMNTSRKTIAEAERELRELTAKRGLEVRLTLTPLPAASEEPKLRFLVLGAVVSPGHYESDDPMTAAALVRLAGGAAVDSDGTAVVIEDLARKWKIRMLNIKKPEADENASTGAGLISGGVLFLPVSPRNLKSFINEVLPYLTE